MNTKLLDFSGKIQFDTGLSTDSDLYGGFRLSGKVGYTTLKGIKTGATVNIGIKTKGIPIPPPEISKWINVFGLGYY